MVFGGLEVGPLAIGFQLELTNGGLVVHIASVVVVVRVRASARACVI